MFLIIIEAADIPPGHFSRVAREIPFKRALKRLSLADKGMMMGLGKRGMIGDRGMTQIIQNSDLVDTDTDIFY